MRSLDDKQQRAAVALHVPAGAEARPGVGRYSMTFGAIQTTM
jgi:hypothetical protein